MKTVFFFLYDLKIGGTEKVVIYLANYLANQNLQVNILTVSDHNDLKILIDPKISLFSLNKTSLKSSIIPLYSFVRNNNVDVLISNVWPLTVISSFIRIVSNKTKLIFIDHCNLSEEFKNKGQIFKKLQQISIYFLYKLAHSVVAVSKGVKNDLIDKGVAKDKITVIYNPLYSSNEVIIKPHINLNNWLDTKQKKIISVGEFKKQKNFINLIEAINIFYDSYDLQPQVLILGDGSERPNMEAKINLHSLNDVFSLPGWVDDPIPFLKKSDLFVLSSDFEGFGVVIAEALSEGINVVSTNCPSGPSEILLNGKLGYLCKVNDPLDLAKSIYKGLTAPINSKPLIKRSKDFSIEKIGKKYLEIIL